MINHNMSLELKFNKFSVVELNNQQLNATDSGSSPYCAIGAWLLVESSIACGIAVGAAISAYL